MENVPENTDRVHKYMAKSIKRLAKLVRRLVADPLKSRGRRHTLLLNE